MLSLVRVRLSFVQRLRMLLQVQLLKRLSTQMISIQQLSSTEEIWNTSIQMVTSITSWITKLTNSFLSMLQHSLITLSLLRKIWYVRFFPTREMFSVLSHLTLLSLRLLRQTQASRVIQLLM